MPKRSNKPSQAVIAVKGIAADSESFNVLVSYQRFFHQLNDIHYMYLVS